jgi:hypothetical protein
LTKLEVLRSNQFFKNAKVEQSYERSLKSNERSSKGNK